MTFIAGALAGLFVRNFYYGLIFIIAICAVFGFMQHSNAIAVAERIGIPLRPLWQSLLVPMAGGLAAFLVAFGVRRLLRR